MTDAPPYEPDTKDWTWVLEQPCEECGYDAARVAPSDLGTAIRDNAAAWAPVLARPDAVRRPAPTVWSPTEYACHVRDVHRIFAERVRLMLDQDDPEFPNWDQDATALAERYDLQRPDTVGLEMDAAAREVAGRYDAVPADGWGRSGRRSNGSRFTVASLGAYHLHDVVHHLWDVTS
jgi:hypothetical protein